MKRISFPLRTPRVLQSGQALIELLVAFGVFGIFSVGITTLSVDALWAIQTGPEHTAASAYAHEGLEAARQIADRSWTALTLGDHGVTIETAGAETRYAFSSTSDTRGILSRVVRVEDAQRDANGNIVTQGGTSDPDTRRVISTVTWQTGFTRRQAQTTTTTLLTNWESFSWTETLEADFRQGTLASTEVLAMPPPPTGNGSVRLAGAVDWTAPVVRGTFDAVGSGDGRAVAVRNGYAYLVTDDGPTGRLIVIDVSDITAPELVASAVLPSPGVDVVVSGGYAYVALDGIVAELAVVDIRTPLTSLVAVPVDLPGTARARSVAVESNLLLVGREGRNDADELIATTLENPALPTSRDTLNLSGDPDVNTLALRTGSAVLGTSGDAAEIITVNVGTPSNITTVGTLDLSGNANVTGVSVSGSRVYVTRDGDVDFVIVDISTLAIPSVAGSLDLGNGANDVASEGGFAFTATRQQGNEFQRVDAGTPGNLSVAGTTNVGAEPKGIAFVGNYAFLATAGNDRELTIVGGGEGGWANPTPLGSVNLSGGKPLLSVAVLGDYAYAGREKTEGNGEFIVFDIREPRQPAFSGQLEINDSVRDIATSGHRAFVATDKNDKELLIVDTANPASPTEIGSFNTTGNADGLSVFVSGNLAAIGTGGNSLGPEVTLLDVTDPAAPLLRGTIDIQGNRDVTAIRGTNTTLFLATLDAARDVQVYDITVPAAPVFLGSYDTVGTGNPTSLALRGTELYVGTRNNGGGDPELFILDVSVPALPHLVSGGSALDVGGDILGLDVAGTVGFVGTNRGDEEFQTVNLANLASPSILGVEEVDASVNDVIIAGTYAYLATAETDAEFQIFKSSDAAGFATAGTYDSIAFDSGSANTVWESASWNALLNAGTLQFQLRRGDTQAALESALFVGPDGTVNTFYDTSPAALTLPNSTDPLPGRWIQWRATFAGTQAATPEVQDVTVTFRQ
ncbi:MAG: hypothetical protein G01um1014106_125 [Parcubacteria group bacterium Gr01-1014_106]|nr:MAG: hypothetical protein G01um1014106_125 [Parcubacteria group bacterium Gr01-1014_106]